MKRLLLLFLILTSCKKEVYYYPSKSFFDEKKPTEIIIDELNFEKVSDTIRSGLFMKQNYFIVLEDSKNIFKISPFAYTGGLIKEKNVLEIFNDSLSFSGKKYSINELENHLKTHYENNGKVPYLSDSHKRAMVRLVFEKDDSSSELKKKLLFILKSFNKSNIVQKDSIAFNLMLDYPLETVRLPPPPPIEIE